MSKKYVCDFCLKIFDNESQLSLFYKHDNYYDFFPKKKHICFSCQAALKKALSNIDAKEFILSFKDKE